MAWRVPASPCSAHPDKAIREGYVVHLLRQKTRRPDLRVGKDLKATLAEHCTVDQLAQIRDTVVNRISVREGIADHGRNKKQKTKSERTRRSVKTLAPPFELPDDLPDF